MIPIGLWLPEGGIAIKNTGWATPVLVGVMMSISGFTLNTGKLQSQTTNLGAIGLVLVSTYCVAPLVAYGLAIGLQGLAPWCDHTRGPLHAVQCQLPRQPERHERDGGAARRL